jgi:hypothetical protein
MTRSPKSTLSISDRLKPMPRTMFLPQHRNLVASCHGNPLPKHLVQIGRLLSRVLAPIITHLLAHNLAYLQLLLLNRLVLGGLLLLLSSNTRCVLAILA